MDLPDTIGVIGAVIVCSLMVYWINSRFEAWGFLPGMAICVAIVGTGLLIAWRLDKQ